jgi:hypothetical protein
MGWRLIHQLPIRNKCHLVNMGNFNICYTISLEKKAKFLGLFHMSFLV